jgi:hypothetical protein
MTGRGRELRGEGTQPHSRSDVRTYDPVRDALQSTTGEQSSTAGRRRELSSDQISSAEQKLMSVPGDVLQAQKRAIEHELGTNSSLNDTKRNEYKKALELIKQEQNNRTAGEILETVRVLGEQKPGVRDRGPNSGSIFREY